MNSTTQQTTDDDVRALAIAHLEAALALLDQLGLSTPAARLDFVLSEVRDKGSEQHSR